MAINITKVYTRTGDEGETGLVGGRRVPKDSLRIEAYGALDELNAVLGIVRACNQEHLREPAHKIAGNVLEDTLKRLQNELFDLGSELATDARDIYEGMFRVSKADVLAMEELIDHFQADLTPLKSFILPGGGQVSAHLHLARTVCRRAEREIIRLSRIEDIGSWTIVYVNRLSDLLFVLSRWAGKQFDETELLWERGLRGHG